MNSEELMKVIDTMQKIIDGLLTQNVKQHEELKHSNRDFFVLAGLITITLLLMSYGKVGRGYF